MKYHLDENVPHAIASGLRRHGIDVTTTTEAGLLEAEDEEHLEYGLTQNRVVVTQDQDMLILAAQGVVHAGIAFWKPGTRSIGQIVRKLIHFHDTYEESTFLNNVEYL